MVRLTLALISALNEGADLATITSLILSRRDLDEIVSLDACTKLARVDLSGNNLTSLQPLSLCTSLKWLSVAGNKLTSLRGVECLTKLTVLNASKNALVTMDEVAGLTALRALILNDNNIETILALDQLTNLDTLVFSHNPVRRLGTSLSKLVSLTKLSLSYCKLQVLGDSIKQCIALKELRLAHNQLIGLPKELEQNAKLEIIDLGNNCIKEWKDIQVLRSLSFLSNLNLRGNSICMNEEQITTWLPKLAVFDSRPLQTKKKYGKNVKSKEVGRDHGIQAASGKNKKKKFQDSAETEGQNLKFSEEQDDMEKKPFLELVIERQDLSSKPMKDEVPRQQGSSGVVCILGNNNSHSTKRSKLSLLDFGKEIGTGGPSAWDDPIGSKTIVAENDKLYSRWKLKKPK